MNGHSNEPYELPSELIYQARESWRWLRERSDEVVGNFLERKEFPVLYEINPASPNMPRWYINNTDLLDFLAPVTQSSAVDSAESRQKITKSISFKTKAGVVILQFIRLFFDEIRKLICKSNKTNFSVGKEMALALTSLAHWLAAHFGIVEELAKVTASAVLVAIASATKGAFCRLTAN